MDYILFNKKYANVDIQLYGLSGKLSITKTKCLFVCN